MLKRILGVVVGYITMFVLIFITFTILYLILGADGAFEPDTYHASGTWLVMSFILGLLAAVLGGFVCVLIAKERKAALWLAGLVLVIGFAFAIPALGESDDARNIIREGDISNTEAMQNAKQPPISLILNPIIGAIGVIIGSRLKKGEHG
jgi:hypothetical protein